MGENNWYAPDLIGCLRGSSEVVVAGKAIIYADDGKRTALNSLVFQYDDTGLQQCTAYDFWGSPVIMVA